MLGPTTESLDQPDAIPYFAWDLGKTVQELRAILDGDDREARDEVLVRLLREANSRDVWMFADWTSIEEAWPRIAHRLGRARAVWELMRRRRAEVQARGA
ncbi:MAG: hypothetical protein RIF41_15550 [Polyangiaceae bacterium]